MLSCPQWKIYHFQKCFGGISYGTMHQDPDVLPLQALPIKQHSLQKSQAVLFIIKDKHETMQKYKKLRTTTMHAE